MLSSFCRNRGQLLPLIISLLGIYCGCNALNPIEIRGYKFFDSVTDEEFRIRGIDYYPRPNIGPLNVNSLDYFTEEHRHMWERDLPYLQELGVNAIRIYAINSRFNHDAFFCALERAGIYAIIELATEWCAVTRDPAPDCYPIELKRQGQDVIRKMSQFSSVLGFSAGNEVNHYAPSGFPQHNAPCEKKFLRDMRQYVESCAASMRHVPIGLVSADSDRDANALYYNCQSDPNDPFEAAEWFGLNSYVNCDGKARTYDEAMGFKLLQASFASYNYSIPVVLTEFGCVSDTFPTIDGYEGQRDFKQFYWLQTLSSVRDQFVGGFAFEYSMEMEIAKGESPYPFTKFGAGNYGIGYFRPENCNDITIPCAYHPLPNFESLRQAYVTVRDNATDYGVALVDYLIPESRKNRTVCPSEFPALNDFHWEADRVGDLSCPPRDKPMAFVCPANLDDLRPKPSMVLSQLFMWTAAVIMVMMLVIIGFMLLLRQAGKNTADDLDKLPFSVIVAIPKLLLGDDDAASNESEGLMSMKHLPKGDYQAIDSDASSDDN